MHETNRLVWRLMAVLLAVATAGSIAGCQSSQQALENEQAVAVETAVRRGKFDLGCQEATGTVLSSDMLQPVLWRGTERAEYQVGVSGCGKRATYVVVCPMDSKGCVAGSARNNATMGN